MAIVNVPATTRAQLWQQRAAKAEARNVKMLKRSYASEFNAFWSDPAIGVQALGTGAVKWFQAAAAMVALIQMSDPTFQPFPIPNKPGTKTPWTFAEVSDGSVTVG